MASALRRLSGLFYKQQPEPHYDPREFYSRSRDSSSDSSSSYESRRRSSSPSHSNPPPKKNSWLKRKASKVLTPTAPTTASRSTRSGSKLSRPRADSSFDAAMPDWERFEVERPPIRHRGREWSFDALDEASLEEEHGRATTRDRRSRPVVESSSQARRRRQDRPSPEPRRSTRRAESNSSHYWNRLAAPSSRWTALVEEENEETVYAESNMRHGGVSLPRGETSARGAASAAITAWRDATIASTSRPPRGQSSLGVYLDRLARWSEYSPVPDTEFREGQDEVRSSRVIAEEDQSESPSDEDEWWSDRGGEGGVVEHTDTQTTIPEPQTPSHWKEPNEVDKAGPPETLDVPSRMDAEIDSLHERRPRHVEESREQGDEVRAKLKRRACTPDIDEELATLEDTSRDIQEQMVQIIHATVRTCDEGGLDVDERAIIAAQEEVRCLEVVREQIQAEIVRLRDVKMARGDRPFSARANGCERSNQEDLVATLAESAKGSSSATAVQEELDRQHALRLQQEIDEDDNQPSSSAEQEELDHQHALQLQQDLLTEQEKAAHQASVAPRTRDCPVCAESKPSLDFPLLPPTSRCQHTSNLCSPCLQTWVSSELDSKGGSTNFKCPECPEQMDYSDVRAAASEEIFAAYDKLAMRSALGGLDEFAWCLRSGCGNGQLNVENHHYMICQACGYRQCLRHRVEWHWGESCEEYEYRVSGRKARDEAREGERKLHVEARRKVEEEMKTEAMIGTVSKACPARCGRRIQRNMGCDHMTCKCGYEFCWECLAPQKRIDLVGNTAHERSCKNHSNNVR